VAIDLSTLNRNQRKAVDWNDGPMLVLAGPGSGKTRVLTIRIARLLDESPDERFRILALTFTDKAAREMRGRVDELLSEGRERALLTTFHSFAAEILRQHGSHVGLRPDFTILPQKADQEAVLADAIEELQGKGVDVDPSDVKLLPVIERLLSRCESVAEVAKRFGGTDLDRLPALYGEYRNQLISDSRLDYGMLLCSAIELLEKKPAIARQFHIIYKHVCVDEFQDTNLSQYRLLRLLVPKQSPNVFVVADDDQIIYQWNGAAPERLEQLKSEYSMDVIQLPENYRCPPQVIELANLLIKNNLGRSAGKKPLVAIKKTAVPESVRVRGFASMAEELAWVAKDVAARPTKSRSGCVVLGRTRKLLQAAVSALEAQGVGATMALRKDDFESTPFRWLHAVLRLANARHDREQLRRVCETFFKIEGVDLRVRDVEADASSKGGDFLRAWIAAANARKELESGTQEMLKVAGLALADRMDYFAFKKKALVWLDAMAEAANEQGSEAFADYEEEKAIWSDLERGVVERYGQEELSLSMLLHEFDLAPKLPPVPPNAVRCLTIHAAKGMEFDHVYLIGLAEDQLPSFEAKKKGPTSRELQEERRNCFVAITRAQSTLTMTYATEYFGWSKQPSRFLEEMGLLE
jgi:DNA helicase II / ATP-dependent DNA helicase PcrA